MRLMVCLCVLLCVTAPAVSGDWPAWRFDSQRSAAAPDELPRSLRLQWSRQLPVLTPAWPDQASMQFDVAYEPIVAGRRLFVGSSHDDSVTAYDTRSGDELWRFFADGPVRFAPVEWEDRLYFASDDGHLYCLKADDGSLIWRFRGGPSDRKVLGNERVISTWPARGAPVIADDTVYFAAGIWPFMGIFLHAIDARTGEVRWTNDGDGSLYIKQPHNTDSFAGVAPQGPLVVAGDRLLVPGGRSVPACYDRHTGKLIYYQLAENAKRGGGSSVSVAGSLLLNGGAAFQLETEKYLGSVGKLTATAEGVLFSGEGDDIRAIDLETSRIEVRESVDRKGEKVKSAKWTAEELANADMPEDLTALICAGSRLYAGAVGKVFAVELPLPKSDDAKIAWDAEIEGTPLSLVAADDRLFVSTREGRLYAFGDGTTKSDGDTAVIHPLPSTELAANDRWSQKIESLLDGTKGRGGYGVVWGAGDGSLVLELLRQSDMRWIVVEPEPRRAGELRNRLRQSGIGGDRAAVVVAAIDDVSLPPYLASLMVVEALPSDDKARETLLRTMFASLRPFGGTALLLAGQSQVDALAASGKRLSLEGAEWKTVGDVALLVRPGPLPGSADWTHEHADAANTRVSKDTLVKAPLGLLWFGGTSNEKVLPRHGHGPQPQVVDGRLFIEGPDMVRAMDIYTGRVLWEVDLPGVGEYYDNTAHQPGANARGTNYVSTPDGIYVAYRNACLQLDPATGRELARFHLPAAPGAKEPPLWGYLNVAGDFLIGGADPLQTEAEEEKRSKKDDDSYSSSQRLVVMDRATGKVRWTAEARSGFRHNAVCLGGGRIYCIDRLSDMQVARLKRRGLEPPVPARLVAFDLKTGEELWSSSEEIFGTWLSYSADHDMLVEAGRGGRDTLSDEPKGMRVYRGDDGSVAWFSKTMVGPAMIHHDTILTEGSACSLLTGAPKLRNHPLSGEPVEWKWTRNYGCNTPMASEHLLTFRSGAAGYFDLCRDGGTGNFGGFRSSCSNNLIVAGGLLTAPDYTRTCTCSYQNQTSLALVPTPDAEMWTSFVSQTPKEPIRQLGINLGAPGDRREDDGMLWLEYPVVGGSSPDLSVKLEPAEPEWFRRHSSQVGGEGPAWVAASGALGLTAVRVRLDESKNSTPRRYTVRLHFLEPDEVDPGKRVFDVRLQGETVLKTLDVVGEAGGRNRALVKEFSGVVVERDLTIELKPEGKRGTVLSGIEVRAEGW